MTNKDQATKTIFTKLRWGKDNLSSKQSVLCSYLLDNYSQIAFLTVEELSKKTKISPATIIRTTKSLGFDGYKEMLAEFEDILLANNVSLWWEMEKSITEKKDEKTPIWVTKDNIETIKFTLTKRFINDYQLAIDMLNRSRRICIAAVRSSRATGIFFHSMLSQFMDNVFVISYGEEEAYESLIDLTCEDTLVVISLGGPHFAITPVNLIRFAKENRIKTLLLTNDLTSPAVEHAQIALFVAQTKEHYSVVPTTTILESFIVDLAKLKKHKAKSKFKRLEEILVEQNITY